MKKIITYLIILSSAIMLSGCFGQKTSEPQNVEENTGSTETQNPNASNDGTAETQLSNISVSWVENQELDLEKIAYNEEDDSYVFDITWAVDGYITSINLMMAGWSLAEPIKYTIGEKTWSAKIKMNKDFVTKWEAKISVQGIEETKGVKKPISTTFKVFISSQKDEK